MRTRPIVLGALTAAAVCLAIGTPATAATPQQGAVDGACSNPTIIAEPGRITNGTAGNDIILGTDGADDISGYGGNDIICAGAGNDIVSTLGGKSRIYGGEGADTIWVSSGKNTIYGEGGDDTLTSMEGADTIYAGTGDDKVYLLYSNRNFADGGPGTDAHASEDGNTTVNFEGIIL